MKIIAHRGWSMGEWENSLSALERSAIDARINGIEIDVRWSERLNDVVVLHDPIEKNRNDHTHSLEEILNFGKQHNWDVYVEIKEYSDTLVSRIVELLEIHDLLDNAVIFGFEKVASLLDWKGGRKISLGVISMFPWQISRIVETYQPEVLLMGWDERKWTQFLVRLYWNLRDFSKIKTAYPNVLSVFGVAQSQEHLDWIEQHGADVAIVDMEHIGCP